MRELDSLLAQNPILRVGAKGDDTEHAIIKSLRFNFNFALNELLLDPAKSFLQSDLFMASLIACNQFVIIVNKTIEGNPDGGAEFLDWILNEIASNEKFTHNLQRKLRFMVFCLDTDGAGKSLKKYDFIINKDVRSFTRDGHEVKVANQLQELASFLKY